MMKENSLLRFASVLFIISMILLVVILAKNILVPLAFALLLSYLFYPIVWRLERAGLHRILSILLVIVVAIAVVAAVVYFFSMKIVSVQIDLNELKDKIVDESGSPSRIIEQKFGVNMRSMEYYFDQGTHKIISTITASGSKVFTTTATTIFQIFILPVFTFFILFYRTKNAHFILKLTGRKNRKKTVKIMREVTTVTSRYLAGLLGVVLILSVLNSTGLTIIGVPHPVVLGVGAALLNLIPYFGTLLGALIPLVYVLISIPDPIHIIIQVIIMFIIVQFLENNIITPNIVGNNVRLNALTIILGLLVGNLIWGIAGMLVVIPFIAILKIVMRNIESLKPFAYLLSSKGLEEHRIHVTAGVKKLKRKLAGLWQNSGKKD